LAWALWELNCWEITEADIASIGNISKVEVAVLSEGLAVHLSKFILHVTSGEGTSDESEEDDC